MKQIWPNYSYSPTTNVLTLTGLNIDRDQLLLVTAADRGRIMYNFADSSVTASAFTSGANTALTLVATTAGLTTTAALVIYYDDQLASTTVTISSLPAISGTVTANLNTPNFVGTEGDPAPLKSVALGFYSEIDGEFRNVGDVNNKFPISGTVSLGIQQSDDADANIKFIPIGYAQSDGGGQLDYWVGVKQTNPLPVYFPSTFSLPAGTNQIGVVTIGGGTVTIGAGTAQIGSVTAGIGLNSFGPSVLADNGFSLTSRGMMVVGGISTIDVGSDNEYRELKITSTGEALVRGSVTASISGTVPISISSVTVGNSVTIGSLPAISGTVTANTFAVQGTAVTTSNFTSTTASTVLANYNATREVLTIFNEGAGQLFVCAGSLCTTTAFQVRLSAGDYYEVPNHQTTITHSAVFATGGTARVTEVS